MTHLSRWTRTSGLWIVFALFAAAPASAQIVQSIHVGVGGFIPRGFDSRDAADTLVADLSDAQPLAFNIGRFKSGMVFGEWNVAVGNHIELGLGASYYSDAVPSVYANVVNANGNEIQQTLRLRMVPITGMVRFLPFGRPTTFQPYAGVGISAIRWRYSESGEFVDGSNNIFTDRFIATGTTAAPVVALGARMPVGGDIYALTLEWRYQFGAGNTGGLANNFLGDKIDLSGGMINFGFMVRF